MAILSKNWSFYHKSSINLQTWELDMDFDEMNFETAPMWIQLPKLKARCWCTNGLNKLASYVGHPITMDKLTTSRFRLSYARILVKVNTANSLPDFIPITIPNGEVVKQLVIYEHLLPKCSRCGFTGHTVNQCRKKNEPPKHKQQTIVNGSDPNIVNRDTKSVHESLKEALPEVPESSEPVIEVQKQIPIENNQKKDGDGTKKVHVNTGGGNRKANQ